MENYIGEIIGAIAVIIAALIGLFARNRSRNKQIVKKSNDSTVYQANGSINSGNTKKDEEE